MYQLIFQEEVDKMLRKQMEQHIKNILGEQFLSQIELHKEEMEYVEKYSLVEDGIKIVEKGKILALLMHTLNVLIRNLKIQSLSRQLCS